MSKSEFQAVRAQITENLAHSFANKLKEMGEDIRGITWFSSSAEAYAAAQMKRAA